MRILFIFWLFSFFLPLCPVLFGIGSVSGQGLGGSRSCRKDEELLLLQLKNSLTFNPTVSVKLETWSESLDCCSWGGVTCDFTTGHVVGLDLSMESISGGFNGSSSLFNLQHLQIVNLAYNYFNLSQIPPEFGKLDKLTYLNLSNAGFSGQIPIEISRLTSLVTIDFSLIYFFGVPTLKLEKPNLRMLVQNLTGLKELFLDGVKISATGKEWCQALSSSAPNLQVLSLSNCFLSGPLDSSLQKLRSLLSIRLDSNNFSAAPVPDFIANFSNLTRLKLSSCGLIGTFPEKIFMLPTLRVLDLSNNRLLEGSFPEFPQNGSLETLVLSDTKFSGQVPNSIGNLKGLIRIELRGCNFSGIIPKAMGNLTQLVYLDFSGNAFSGPIPSLSFSKNLTQIYLAGNNLTGQIASSHLDGLLNLETLDLHNNSLNGNLPTPLFSLPSLQKIQLSNNQFSGPFSEFKVGSSSVLDTLDLSSNNLEGPIPHSIFQLQHLSILDISSNKFNGTVELSRFQKLRNLTNLSLSYNNFSIDASLSNGTSSLLPNFTTLKLASCHLSTLPDLSSQPKLIYLDLAENELRGNIPNWIWKIGSGFFLHLNLSHNLFEDLEKPLSNFARSLSVLDLHSNQLRGQIPIPTQVASYLDYSNNSLSSSIPDDIGEYVSSTIFFSLSKNRITGTIPASICNATYLQVLDFSDNNLAGEIPLCLIENGTLAVLNLRRNNFTGTILGNFPVNCPLQTLDLNENSLHGKIPRSLANCKVLEVLNLGNNRMSDIFPCFLKNITSLRVLVLRANEFHGSVGCPKDNSTWAMLQIVDLAHNKFNGSLPAKCFSTWTAMMTGENESHSNLKHLQFKVLQFSQLYYQDAVTVTSKGQEMEFVKVLTIFTSIDLSCNNLEGVIPEAIGKFTMLYVLNLSNNGLTGQILSSIGNLRQLESLDLSQNRLSGEIPAQLAKLYFLSVLNLSFNQLVGRIPPGTQLQSFSETSYEGNPGLWGPPLTPNGSDPPPTQEQNSEDKEEFDWEFIITGLGFGLGVGVIVAPLNFWKKGRKWLDENVERFVLLVILPIVQLIYTNYGRVEAEEAFGVELTDITRSDEDSVDEKDEIEDESFGIRFCVFCSRLDLRMKRPIHDPNCSCHDSPAILSPFDSSSSSSSQT